MARTRLTLQTPGIGEAMSSTVFDPENISPLVAVLASETCRFNGQVFSVYGGSVGIYAGWSIAEEVETDTRWTPDALPAAALEAARQCGGQRPDATACEGDASRRLSGTGISRLPV